MKKFISILLLLFILNIILNSWSGVLSDQVVDYIAPTQEAKSILNANVQLQRSLGSTALALATAQPQFLNEALERVKVAESLIDENNNELKYKLKSIKIKISTLKIKSDNKNPISKEELLQLSLLVEDAGKALNKSSQSLWGENIDLFQLLIKNYEQINWGIRVFQIISLILFFYLIFAIYQRERAEANIRKKEKLHGLLFASLSEAVFLCDPDGTIKSCNFSAGLLLQLSPQELIGKNILSLITEEKFDRKLKLDNLKDLICRGDSLNDLVTTAKIGAAQKWLSINAQPIIEEEGKSSFQTILSIRDITKGVEANKLIKDQQVQLIESAKMQSIGEMASGIAHEINNPLSIISTTSSRLSRKARRAETVDSEEVKTVTTKIANTVDRMARIVRSLLTMAHGGTGDRFEYTSLNDIIGITLDFCHPILEKNQISKITADIDESLKIECHTTQISQVILNLIKNGAQAIKELPEKWIEIKAYDRGEFVRIEIVDSGNGIAEENREKILQPFYTTRAIGEGTGLGLSISRKIVEYHDGKFGIDSTNRHTCFFIELPKNQKSIRRVNRDSN